MKHANGIGGSAAARCIACPGHWSLKQTLPKPPSSDYAGEGSMLHEVASMTMDGEHVTIGYQYTEGTSTFEYTDALDKEMMQPALALFDELDEEIGPIE